MSKVEVIRKLSSFDIGIPKSNRIRSVLKSSYKLLIFVPVMFTLVFIHAYQTFRQDAVCSIHLSHPPHAPPKLHNNDTTTVSTPFTIPVQRFHSQKRSVPPLTIQLNEGRLGNQMFTFATLLGLSVANGRDLAVMPDNHYVLARYFNMKDYPVLDDESFVESDPWEITNWLRNEDFNIPESSNIIKGHKFPTSFTFFHHCREKVKEAFKFHPVVTRYVHKIFEEVRSQIPSIEVFIGVHVRRGDYIKKDKGGWLRAFNGREVDDEYFKLAVQHFTGRYSNAVFLAVSDDRGWAEKNLKKHGINLVASSPSEEFDLALLAHCNHTIMTYGTYGFWGGYLSGGDVVYFDDFLKPGTKQVEEYYRFDKMYPEEWVGISTTPPGYWGFPLARLFRSFPVFWNRRARLRF
ncbi:hypothetical protein JTE90_002447 [Oedothorax gibbosus]|uniref:L-Fucosyltransferase n=1 Tax=Oedothorax gibbosus TaxID=931172 RepID=A0AAV6UUU9_9ARAC|nr:hypothetical protein JTE90_002447 [Oedothorax gibbosus]